MVLRSSIRLLDTISGITEIQASLQISKMFGRKKEEPAAQAPKEYYEYVY
jgi:hypothetical protein